MTTGETTTPQTNGPGTTHRYAAQVSWRGTTRAGYRDYSRDHTGSTGTGPASRKSFELSADPAFRGNPLRANPEELLVLAASSCQLLSFLARAARAGIEVLGYEDDALGLMPERGGTGREPQPTRIESIALRPVITVRRGTDPALVEALAEQAHDGCYIANSLSSRVSVEVTVRTSAPPPDEVAPPQRSATSSEPA
jgi:organic hydroperoxide reductase OsmC/OhrA